MKATLKQVLTLAEQVGIEIEVYTERGDVNTYGADWSCSAGFVLMEDESNPLHYGHIEEEAWDITRPEFLGYLLELLRQPIVRCAVEHCEICEYC